MKKLVICTIILRILSAIPSIAAVGPQPTAVVLLKFADHSEEPCSPANAATLVFNQYSQWLQAESRGQEWLTGGPAWGWWTLPHNLSYYCPAGSGSCLNYSLLLDADALAVAHGYSEHWNRRLTVLYLNTDGFTGTSGDAQIVWAPCPELTGAQATYILRHEGGHAQGLPHANSWTCTDADVGEDYVNVIYQNTLTCKWSEYGDKYDPMGFAAGPLTHYALKYQTDLGWRSAANIKTTTASESVTLARADATTPFTQEVRIPIPSVPDYFYSLEYWVDNGVLIRFNSPRGSGILSLVNNTWPNAWEYSSAVTAANPFYDPYRHISVQLISSTSTSATLTINMAATSAPLPPPPPTPPPTHGHKKGNR